MYNSASLLHIEQLRMNSLAYTFANVDTCLSIEKQLATVQQTIIMLSVKITKKNYPTLEKGIMKLINGIILKR